MNRAALACCVALLLGVLSGCAGGQPGSQTDAGSGSATRTVVDMTGRHVRLPVTITRVATDYPALDASMLALGKADLIVATSPGVGPLFDTLVPKFRSVPQPFNATLTGVRTEALLAAQPQVVLASPAAKPALATFARLHIPVVIFQAFQNPTQLKAGADLLGQVLGGDAPARATAFDSYYDANIAKVTARTTALQRDRRPSVYYTAGNPLQTEGANSIVDSWITAAGGRIAAAENGVKAPPTFATPTLESVLSWNPDVIVCREAGTVKENLADPRWSAVAAVRNHRVYANPTGVFVWSVRSVESALEPLWGAKTLHPELFGDLDTAAETTNFYQTFYHYDLSVTQAAAILNPQP